MLTRYPVPGTTKRRLGDALGPGGAAMLHRDLAAHCFRRIVPMAVTGEALVEVRFEGGSPHEVRSWLPGPALVREQGAGHLGDRLREAAEAAFTEGARRVVLLGSDCPDAGAPTVRRALALLGTHDLAIGPAEDGGYYLIALSWRVGPEARVDLFGDSIPWGGSDVLRATLAAAERQGLSAAMLPALRDIDRPEDLALWQRVRAQARRVREDARISVVIPTWNEADLVAEAIESARVGGAYEVIVADGGSDDETVDRAKAAGAVVVEVERRGRSAQMNAGARAAEGDVVLFLHADCVLPDAFAAHVRSALTDPAVVGGAFGFALSPEPAPAKPLIAATGAVRARFGIPYGDQGLFVPTTLFRDLGGFPDQPTMEDYEFARRLRRLGALARIPVPVRSSGRLWREHGLVRPTASYLAIITGYRLGVPAEKLAPIRSWMSDREAPGEG